jgi:hypothetical protein
MGVAYDVQKAGLLVAYIDYATAASPVSELYL